MRVARRPRKRPLQPRRRRMMIEVVNRQRGTRIDCQRWREFTEHALRVISPEADGVSVAFVSDRVMLELNRRWRGKRATTDVLSFPAAPEHFEKLAGLSLGEVVIAVDQAARQALEHGLEFDEEVSQLILHGLLHLSGYDHETDSGEMNSMELRLRRRLGI